MQTFDTVWVISSGAKNMLTELSSDKGRSQKFFFGGGGVVLGTRCRGERGGGMKNNRKDKIMVNRFFIVLTF